jgi:hypothetical protein
MQSGRHRGRHWRVTMDTSRFDRIVKTLPQLTTRRAVLQLLAGILTMLFGLTQVQPVEARCRMVCRRTPRGRQCRRVCDNDGYRCSPGFGLCAVQTPSHCRRICRRTPHGRRCRRVCQPGQRATLCTDLRSDVNNCGGCGRTCQGACIGGQCTPVSVLLPTPHVVTAPLPPPPPAATTCAPYGDVCSAAEDCCNDVPCTLDRCRYP